MPRRYGTPLQIRGRLRTSAPGRPTATRCRRAVPPSVVDSTGITLVDPTGDPGQGPDEARPPTRAVREQLQGATRRPTAVRTDVGAANGPQATGRCPNTGVPRIHACHLLGLRSRQDVALVRRAVDDGYVLVTNDRGDFTSLMERKPIHPGLVCVNVAPGLMSLAVQQELFEHALGRIPDDELAGQVLEVTLTADPCSIRYSRAATCGSFIATWFRSMLALTSWTGLERAWPSRRRRTRRRSYAQALAPGPETTPATGPGRQTDSAAAMRSRAPSAERG